MSLSDLNVFRIVAALAFVVVSAVCGIWSTLVQWEIMDKVNARLPENQRFQPLFWGPFKRARLKDEYRRLFPEGNDVRRLNRLMLIMYAALGFLVVAFLF